MDDSSRPARRADRRGSPRHPDVLVGLGLGPGQPARFLDEFGHPGQRRLVVDRVRPEVQLPQGVAGRGARVERGHHRQRLLAAAQVGQPGLAGDRGRTPDTEDVVHELEGQAEVVAEVGEQLDRRLGRADRERADRGRAAHQRAGLAGRHEYGFRCQTQAGCSCPSARSPAQR